MFDALLFVRTLVIMLPSETCIYVTLLTSFQYYYPNKMANLFDSEGVIWQEQKLASFVYSEMFGLGT